MPCKIDNFNVAIFLSCVVAPQIVEVDRPIAEKGDNTYLRCVATSTLPVNTTWLRDGKDATLDPRFTIQNDTLTITDVKVADAGSYMCTVFNNLGFMSRRVTLEVHCKLSRSCFPVT